MNMLIMMMLKRVVGELVDELLSDENIKKYGDRLFDFFEDAIADSKTTIDDITVLPIIKQLRKSLDIPDQPDQ